MKRINILFTIVIATLFVACSKQPSLETKAKERLKTHITKALADKTKNVSLTDFETILADDSVCVIQCNVNCENYSGEKTTFKMEYYIMWTATKNKSLVENFYIIGEKKSVFDRVMKFRDGTLPSEKSEKARALRIYAPALDNFILKEVSE